MSEPAAPAKLDTRNGCIVSRDEACALVALGYTVEVWYSCPRDRVDPHWWRVQAQPGEVG